MVQAVEEAREWVEQNSQTFWHLNGDLYGTHVVPSGASQPLYQYRSAKHFLAGGRVAGLSGWALDPLRSKPSCAGRRTGTGGDDPARTSHGRNQRGLLQLGGIQLSVLFKIPAASFRQEAPF